MGEDIALIPAAKVEFGPYGQELETRPGQFGPAFAFQHNLEAVAQLMQMQYVAGCVFELLGRQLGGRPVGQLLFLRELNAQKLTGDIFEAVPVGVGAGQL